MTAAFPGLCFSHHVWIVPRYPTVYELCGRRLFCAHQRRKGGSVVSIVRRSRVHVWRPGRITHLLSVTCFTVNQDIMTLTLCCALRFAAAAAIRRSEAFFAPPTQSPQAVGTALIVAACASVADHAELIEWPC